MSNFKEIRLGSNYNIEKYLYSFRKISTLIVAFQSKHKGNFTFKELKFLNKKLPKMIRKKVSQ